MNKKITRMVAFAAAAGTLFLAGCSTGNGEFAPQTYKTPPAWETEGFDISEWPSGKDGDVSAATVISPDAIRLGTVDGKCSLNTSFTYREAFRASRGDEFNSADALYTNAGENNSSTMSETSLTKISGLDFVSATYTTVTSFVSDDGTSEDKKAFVRTAVRAFDKPVAIPYMAGEKNDEGEEYKGIPVTSVTVACDSKKLLTDKLWQNGVDRLKIDFSAPAVNIPVVEEEAIPEEVAVDEAVTEEVVEEAAPEEQTPSTEEPAVTEG